MSESLREKSPWLDVLGATDRELERRVSDAVSAHVAAGDYTDKDTREVGELHRLGGEGRSTLSPEALHHVRRLCQLWEVDLKPAAKITSHRPLIGPCIVAAKRLVFPVVRFFMRETLKQQRDFNAAVVEAVARLSSEVEGKKGMVDETALAASNPPRTGM